MNECPLKLHLPLDQLVKDCLMKFLQINISYLSATLSVHPGQWLILYQGSINILYDLHS